MSGALALLLTAAPAFGPFGSPGHPVTRDAISRAAANPPAAARSASFFEVPYEFYRRVVSPIDGPRCIHRPTCSRYGLLAVRRHGALGLLLTMDRLLRDEQSSALRLLPRFEDDAGWHFLDPLEESTFWFSRSH